MGFVLQFADGLFLVHQLQPEVVHSRIEFAEQCGVAQFKARQSAETKPALM